MTDIQLGNEQVASIALTKALTEAADQVFPIKHNNLKGIPSPPWWDNECNIATKKIKYVEK